MKAVFLLFFKFLRIYNIVLKFRRDSSLQTEKCLLLMQNAIANSFIAIKRKLKRQFIKFTFNSSV